MNRKALLFLSIGLNVGFLGFFKYYNFFLENFINAFSLLGTKLNPEALTIILPVGISFYTFQSMSYTIDVYREKLKPTHDLVAFSAFVSFFPQLVAGPIERASNLLPQFYTKRTFNYTKAVDGMRQILWGLFKKVVIADNCAQFANLIFANHQEYSGSTLVIGLLFFSFQIYGDFSGYSDIAIGTARLFGFNLMQNFNYPYFSRDIAEFWRRWHISLTTWFRDYLYIPLGGSKKGLQITLRNIGIIFIVSGLWHGANWTFVVWGALHALYYVPLLLTRKNRQNLTGISPEKILPSFKELMDIGITFSLVCFAWIFFRSQTIGDALSYCSGIFSHSLFALPHFPEMKKALFTAILVIIFLGIEWVGRNEPYPLAQVQKIDKRIVRNTLYYAVIVSILVFGNFGENPFIYFQF